MSEKKKDLKLGVETHAKLKELACRERKTMVKYLDNLLERAMNEIERKNKETFG